MFHRLFGLLCFSLIALNFSAPINAEESTGTGEARLENRSEPTSMFGLDVRAVDFSSNGKSLNFSVEVDQDIAAYLKVNHAQVVAQFMVDADNDPSSGGEVFGSSEPGFEFTTSVYACKERDDVRVCAGDIDGATTYVGEFETDGWDPAMGMFMPVHDFSWTGGDADIDGNRIRAAIPYEDVGGAPGKSIRIVVAAGSGRPVDIPPVLLTLQ